MGDFQRGFFEELEKIALDFDPNLVAQLPAVQGALPASQQSTVLPLLKTIGTQMLMSNLGPDATGHRYSGYNPPGVLTQFRY